MSKRIVVYFFGMVDFGTRKPSTELLSHFSVQNQNNGAVEDNLVYKQIATVRVQTSKTQLNSLLFKL